MNYAKHFRISFLQNTSRQLLLNRKKWKYWAKHCKQGEPNVVNYFEYKIKYSWMKGNACHIILIHFEIIKLITILEINIKALKCLKKAVINLFLTILWIVSVTNDRTVSLNPTYFLLVTNQLHRSPEPTKLAMKPRLPAQLCVKEIWSKNLTLPIVTP